MAFKRTVETVAKRDSRGLILSAARTEFAVGGYSGARIERVARRAGVNKQLIFYYFGSKAGLYRAALAAAAGELSAGSADTAAPPPLKDALSQIFDRLIERPELVAMVAHDARTGDEPAPAIVQALGQPWRQVREAISAGQGVGLVRDDADPDVLALQVIVLLVGYLALEPALRQLPRAVRRDAWLAATAESLTRILAW